MPDLHILELDIENAGLNAVTEDLHIDHLYHGWAIEHKDHDGTIDWTLTLLWTDPSDVPRRHRESIACSVTFVKANTITTSNKRVYAGRKRHDQRWGDDPLLAAVASWFKQTVFDLAPGVVINPRD